MIAYSGIRVAAGGPELGQGLARLAKISLLGGTLAVLVWLAFAGADVFLGRLAEWRRRLLAMLGLAVALALVAGLLPATAPFIRPKLAFASFAVFYLLSPVITLGGSPPPSFSPDLALYWATGLAALTGVAVFVVGIWRRDTGWAGVARPYNARMAFLLVFIGAALLPVSSMTEGKRYLYLASVGVSLLAGYAVAQLGSAGRKIVLPFAAVVVAVSGWQIQLKAGDWTWAGTMTGDAVRLVRRAEPDACRARNILFLTEPVNVRDVYCHFYDYTFEDPTSGCLPAAVRAVVRVVGNDASVDARWDGANTVVVRVHGVTERLLTSRDLRHFDVTLWPPASHHLLTVIGDLTVAPIAGGQQFDLRLGDAFDPGRWRFLYYSAGRVQELAVPARQPIPLVRLQN